MTLSGRSRDYWDFFASECERQEGPLSAPDAWHPRRSVLLAMAAKGRAGQPMANLIFAARTICCCA
jgi:hypothetical protein